MDQSAYWSAVAQLLPVLGLAHVVESRASIRSAGRFPAWYRFCIGALHFLLLAAIGLSINAALQALLLPQPASSSVIAWSPAVVSGVIAFSVGVLILSPAISALFLALARPASLLTSLSPRRMFRLHMDKRELRQVSSIIAWIKTLNDEGQRMYATMIDNHEKGKSAREAAVKALDRPGVGEEDRSELERYLSEMDSWLAKSQTEIDALEELLASAPDLADIETVHKRRETKVAEMELALRELRNIKRQLAEARWLYVAGIDELASEPPKAGEDRPAASAASEDTDRSQQGGGAPLDP